jgi:hypothetical protein
MMVYRDNPEFSHLYIYLHILITSFTPSPAILNINLLILATVDTSTALLVNKYNPKAVL